MCHEDSHTQIRIGGHSERQIRNKGKHHHALSVGFILQDVHGRARDISREGTTLAYTAPQAVRRKEIPGVILEK
jgi:hypothetical protein